MARGVESVDALAAEAARAGAGLVGVLQLAREPLPRVLRARALAQLRAPGLRGLARGDRGGGDDGTDVESPRLPNCECSSLTAVSVVGQVCDLSSQGLFPVVISAEFCNQLLREMTNLHRTRRCEALEEIYQVCTLLHFSNPNISAYLHQTFRKFSRTLLLS